jgi:hypothetical protein
MNKLFTKIAGLSIGLAMAIGVGVAVGSNKQDAKPVSAATADVTFTAGTDKGTTTSVSKGGITISSGSGNSDYSRSDNYRVYSGKTVTIASTVGNMTKIVFTASSTSYNKLASPNAGSISWNSTTGTWTGNTASVTMTSSGAQSRLTKIVVTYTTSSTTEATGISFSPSSVTVSGGLSGSFTPTLTGGSGNYEKTISWSSSNTTVLPNPANSEDGEVVNFTTNNPASNTTVTLTASVVSPGKSNIGSITITVNHVAEHTITYDANGGTGSMEDSINVVSANEFTAPTGMEFKEWNTSDDGEGTSYEPGDTVLDDTDLYAIWQRLRYTTGFESSEGFTATTTYNTTKIDGPASKQWQFVNGTASSGNVITGGQSAQLRKYSGTTGNPNINMQFNIDEIHSISFNAKSGTANMGVEVFYSTNDGSSWTSIGTETVGTSVVAVEKEISSYVASGRFKIEYTGDNPSSGNRWMSIDDIVVETQSASPTVTAVSLSPSADIALKVGNSETYEVTISGTNLLGTETVDVVLTDDLGDYVSVDTDSGLKNGDTFTVTATDAGGIGELYISYNSGAVDSDHITVMTEEAKTMSSISVHASGTTSYFTGSTFSASGFEIYANYTDSTSEDVTASSIFELMRGGSPVSISTPLLSTDTTVRVSYTELGSTQTTNITIEVVDDTVKTLGWGNRGTVDCLSGTTLGSAVDTSAWTFTATWESEAVTYPVFGSGEGYVHVGLYTTSTPESEGASLSTSYAFSANDDGKYLVAFYNGVRTNSNKQVTITERLNRIDEPTEGGFEVATSISVGDTVYLASTVRELSGISTTSTKYGLATAYTGEPNKLYPLTVAAGSENGSYAFANSSGSYLSVTNGNTLNVNGTLSTSTSFTVSFDEDGNATITSLAYTTRSIQYNAASGQERFANYTNGGQTAVQLWKDVPAGTKDIANKDLKVQHVVVEYAKDFSTKLEDICVAYGSTVVLDLKNEWSDLADEFANWIKNGDKGLEGDEITLALSMFANADSVDKEKVPTADSLQNMLAKYDWIVSHYKNDCADFLHDEASRGAVSGAYDGLRILANVSKSFNATAVIVTVSIVSLAAVGGYFLFRKKKEN